MKDLSSNRIGLKLRWPFGRRLLLAFIFLLAIGGVLEVGARTKVIQYQVPFQAYGTNHIQFEIQMRDFKKYVAFKGAPDCIIMGTSMALRGINPEVLGAAYKEQTGEEITCYNFSVVGIRVSTAMLLSQILVADYHPKLLIYGTSFLDYTEQREAGLDERFLGNPWFNAKLGKGNIKGWLAEHSYAYRILLLWSYAANQGLDFTQTVEEINRWNEQLTAYGYGYSDIADKDIFEPLKPGELKTLQEQLGNYGIAKSNLDGLEGIVGLSASGEIDIIILDMPYHYSYTRLVDENGNPLPEQSKLDAFIEAVHEKIGEMAAQYGVVYWRTGIMEILPNEGWKDRYHLNYQGSEIFNHWLAGQIAIAVRQGDIQNPGRE
ncbi:MAG: hypothetical protein OEZ02_15545 [Anaerolineae bacterium]|nr:hypothetical protein [Anaerolineae bacterium]